LVEVEGRLVGRHYGANHDLVFELASGAETFNAVLERGRGDYVFEKMKPDSLLRVRGVCVVESSLTEDLTPFALLLRSTDDMEVLADPPWWNAGHAAALAIGTLLIGFAANFCFNWVERWRLRAILEERESLAHEMHDTLAQSFAGIGFQLEAIRSSVPDNLETTHRQLNLASDLVRHSHKEARRSISTLRAETYDSGKLLPSLEQCARRMVEGGGVRIVTRTSGSQAPVSPRVMDTLYRIGQEAIANSIRHARPTSLAIELRFCSQWLRLIIADDGIGFAPGADSSGFGVRGMRKRALSISADLQIYSQPGEGTQVQVKVSLPPRATFVSWPIVLSRYMKERLRYGRSTRQTDSHLYRG
jgi:signal transduction histidine kinase